MQDIELKISIGFTAARIMRANKLITEDVAYRHGVELHRIALKVKELYRLRPTGSHYVEDEDVDVLDTIWRTAVDVWSRDEDEAANESVWLMERLTDVGGDQLYRRYLRLCDKINGTNIAAQY